MLNSIRVFALAGLFTSLSIAGVLTPINNLGSLGANDSLDWGQLGPDLTVVPSPSSATSANGLLVAFANGIQDFYAIQQGNTWGGNFNNGDNLLFNAAGGPVTLIFSSSISGIGLRFQSIDFGIFTAYITAFGAGNVNFGSVSLNGTSNNAADGSALFLGVTSSSADITSVQLNVQVNGSDNPFALGSLSIAEPLVTGPVPEPSTIFLAGAGLLAALRFGRKPRA
jgi:hypothetical protein